MRKNAVVNLYDPSPILDDRSKGLADSSHSVGVQVDRVPQTATHTSCVVDHLCIYMKLMLTVRIIVITP